MLFIQHLKLHPDYNPKSTTLFRFSCKRCEQCKQVVEIDTHVCLIKRSTFEYPSKEKFNTIVDVSWTVTARGDRDIMQSTFNAVKNIIDEYFDYGIASTERGQKNNHLHIQATGRIYFPDDELKIKKLGGTCITLRFFIIYISRSL